MQMIPYNPSEVMDREAGSVTTHIENSSAFFQSRIWTFLIAVIELNESFVTVN
jgi:hypothetical protein